MEILKQRNGPVGEVYPMTFRGQWQTYQETQRWEAPKGRRR